MEPKIERLIRATYRKWQATFRGQEVSHIDEEDMSCLVEGRLSKEEVEKLKPHLISCPVCAENLAARLSLKVKEELSPAPELIAQAKALAERPRPGAILEVILKLAEKAMEILNTSGDILVGQEFVPAPVLRSRNIKEFKDEVTVFKDFADIRIEAKIENKHGKSFNLTVLIKEKSSSRVIKDLRITLIKDGTELASYVADSGAVTFENVLLGRYSVQISTLDKRLATLVLEAKS